MKLLIARWGNSLAVRLPSQYIRHAGLAEGDTVQAEVDANGEIRLIPEQAFDKAAFLARIRKLHRNLKPTPSVIEQMRKESRY